MLPVRQQCQHRTATDRFPFAIWHKCWNSVTRSGKAVATGYGGLSGEPALRQRIAEYLALHRRDPCDPEQTVITPGAHSAFTITIMALPEPGDKIWFEDPGPVTTSNLLRTLGLHMSLVDVDADGMDVAGAMSSYPDAQLAFVMPSRHHPLGITLPLPRRLALLEWAQTNDAWIIEDDYDSEFRCGCPGGQNEAVPCPSGTGDRPDIDMPDFVARPKERMQASAPSQHFQSMPNNGMSKKVENLAYIMKD